MKVLAFLMRPSDTPNVIYTKKVICYAAVAGITLFVSTAIRRPPTWYDTSRRVYAAFVLFVTLMLLVVERKIRHNVLEWALYSLGASILMGDLLLATEATPSVVWPYFVILVDVCLVCQLRSRVAKNLIMTLGAWLLLLGLESTYRFGFFDLEGLPSQEVRRTGCDCAKLPCRRSAFSSFGIYVDQMAVVLLDFYFTRGFASSLYEEHNKMNRVIVATEKIATAFSRFDLETAEAVIVTTPLPPPLFDAFRSILHNLYMYRPYLPRSCLHDEDNVREAGSKYEDSVRHSVISESFSSKMMEIHKIVEKKRITFTVTNMLGSHKEASEDITAYQDRYRVFMEEILACYSRVSGVVGVVVGDHVHASFNAVRACAQHARNAVQGAVDLNAKLKEKTINVTTGSANGTAYCGSLGCSELMSVAMIGSPAVAASALQDFARENNYTTVVCGSVYSEVSFTFSMKIILRKLCTLSDSTELVYEVLPNETEKEIVQEEWMYQLARMQWDTYNIAGKQYLLGDDEEAIRVLDIPEERPLVVSEAMENLRNTIMSGRKAGLAFR